MRRDVVDDGAESSDTQRIVIRDCQMVLGRILRCEANVASGLAGDTIAKSLQRASEIAPG